VPVADCPSTQEWATWDFAVPRTFPVRWQIKVLLP